jgi:hypothetical protein
MTSLDAIPPSADSSPGARRFSFAEFQKLTPNMPGWERAAVFSKLPENLQREAWTDSAERIDAYTALLFAETREDG